MSTQKTVLFVNPFDFDFTHQWDSEDYYFPAGKKIYLPEQLAQHFAKHLVDAKLNRLGLPTDHKCTDSTNKNFEFDREKLLKKCVLQEEIAETHTSTIKQDIELLNKQKEVAHPGTTAGTELSSELKPQVFCDSCDSKGVRHKKECPKNPHRLALEPEVKEQVEEMNK